MNAPTSSPKPRHSIWPWVLGLALAPFVVLGGTIWSATHLSRDAGILRREVMAASGGGWHVKIQLTADRTALAAVRGGFSLIKEAPPEAREALAAVRSASVGVYERGTPEVSSVQGEVLAEADKAMARQGWKRLVGVVESGKAVLIYLPADADMAAPSRVCLAVCDRCELVVVSAEVDADKLAQFALRQIDHRKTVRL